MSAELGLLREEAPDMFGLDRRDVDGAATEAGGQQPPDDAPCHVPRLGRQTSHVIHVVVIAEQFRLHRCGADHRRRNGALRAQHCKQVAQCRAEVASVVARGSSAVAVREVTVEELGDRPFVDPVQPQASAARPTREMENAGDIAGERARGVPAFGQVLLERINVRTDRPVREPVDVDAAGTARNAHGGLQKWGHQCTCLQELCLYLRGPTAPRAAPRLHQR